MPTAKTYWLTSGWLDHWDYIFKDWDAAKANETFPAHDKAVVLDAVDHFDKLSGTDPEKVLRICDWMKLEIEPYTASLERLKQLLCECAKRSGHDPVRRVRSLEVRRNPRA